MADQTETAGVPDDVFAEHARNTVIDLAARVVHEVVSKELGLTPGSEPSITDVVAVQALARRGLLVPVELFEDRESERAELEEWRSQVDHGKAGWVLSRIREALGTPEGAVSVHAAVVRAERDEYLATIAETVHLLREAGVHDGEGLAARVRNLIAERDQLQARYEELNLKIGVDAGREYVRALKLHGVDLLRRLPDLRVSAEGVTHWNPPDVVACMEKSAERREPFRSCREQET